jgi:hypothetical protein
VLHQVGVSFDLYYDARKHKIKITADCIYCYHSVWKYKKTLLHFAYNVYLGSVLFLYKSTVIFIHSLILFYLATVPKRPRYEVLRVALMKII